MAAANFPACLAFTLRWEGGKSNHPRDPGGRTLNGVTQSVYDTDRRQRREARRDVYLMTEVERDAIYRKRYWGQIDGDHLRPGEDLAVFDFAVNSGPARAKAALARAALSGSSSAEVAHAVCSRRLSFMHAITRGGGWRVFGPGWGRRVGACEALAVRMAHGVNAGPILNSEARRAAKKSQKAEINAVLSGGAGAIGNAQPVVSGHHWLDVAVLGVGVAAIAAFWFTAWRQSQRAEAFKAEATIIALHGNGDSGIQQATSYDSIKVAQHDLQS